MRLRKIWLLCNLVCIIPGAFAQQFIHPGVLHSEKSLERIKRLVDQKAQPAYGSYEILAKLPEARADYQMKGPFEIISGMESMVTPKDLVNVILIPPITMPFFGR